MAIWEEMEVQSTSEVNALEVMFNIPDHPYLVWKNMKLKKQNKDDSGWINSSCRTLNA